MWSYSAPRPAIAWRSPAVLGLLAILSTGLGSFGLWVGGILEVPARAWWLALILWAARSFLVAGVHHRYFSHRTYRFVYLKRISQFVLGFLAQTCAQGGVLDWGEQHIDHHDETDKQGDPHSPKLGGFWWSHIVWLLVPRPKPKGTLTAFRIYPELVWLNRWHMLSPVTLAAFCLLYGGMAGLLIGFFLSTFVLYNTTWFINSFAHLSGSRRYQTPDTSRNCGWLSLFLPGEQWHNNHHRHPGNPRQGERWYEIDLTHDVFLWPLSLTGWIKLNRQCNTT